MSALLLAILPMAIGAEYLDDKGNGCASAERALRARYAVTDVQCRPSLYKTSYPPKLLLTYTLDGRTYTEAVTVASVHAMDAKPGTNAPPERRSTPCFHACAKSLQSICPARSLASA